MNMFGLFHSSGLFEVNLGDRKMWIIFKEAGVSFRSVHIWSGNRKTLQQTLSASLRVRCDHDISWWRTCIIPNNDGIGAGASKENEKMIIVLLISLLTGLKPMTSSAYRLCLCTMYIMKHRSECETYAPPSTWTRTYTEGHNYADTFVTHTYELASLFHSHTFFLFTLFGARVGILPNCPYYKHNARVFYNGFFEHPSMRCQINTYAYIYLYIYECGSGKFAYIEISARGKHFSCYWWVFQDSTYCRVLRAQNVTNIN